MNDIFEIKRFGVFLQVEIRNSFLKLMEIVGVLALSYLGVCLLNWMFSSFRDGISDTSSMFL